MVTYNMTDLRVISIDIYNSVVIIHCYVQMHITGVVGLWGQEVSS